MATDTAAQPPPAPNPPVSLTLVILPVGTSTVTGGGGVPITPTPVIGPLSIPFTGQPGSTMVSNQTPPAGWPNPAGSSGPIVLLASLNNVLLMFNDPANPGKVCQVDVLPLIKPLASKLTPNALYPAAVQAVDSFGQVSAWGLALDPFVAPGLPPAVPTSLVLLGR
jgi:hypothetical protein